MPEVTVTSGPGPVDEGAYRFCRVLSIGRLDGMDSYCLVTNLSPTGTPSRGQFDFDTEGSRASKFKLEFENQLPLLGWIMPATTDPVGTASMARPERWTYPTGHLGLCVMLSLKSDAILDWIERHI